MTYRRKLFWVAVLYFVEGFPFGLIHNALPVYFRIFGVSLKEIGLMSLVSLPWAIKFFWAPAVDALGRKKHWFVTCQIFIALTIVSFPWLMPSQTVSSFFWVLLIALAFFSATQDIAIDAYTIRLLDEKELGMANGVRVTTYRIALIAAGGVFIAGAGWLGWTTMFLVGGILILLTALVSIRAPETPAPSPADGENRTPQTFSPPGSTRTFQYFVVIPLKEFLARPGFIQVFLFVLLFKLGDMAMGPMIHPFWVDRGFTLFEIGAVPGTVGVVATIIGALLGGYLTNRWGIFRGLWILGLFQAGSNLVYAGAAALPSHPAAMYLASVTESFTGGLGTAPFLAFLMKICNKDHAATQYALLSALFAMTRSVSGAFSGWGAESLGYASYFTFTFILAFPAYAMLPWVRRWLEPANT
ncbi:MAG: MFS transporter [Proteobacteria bacterium]|nr:MFS transporter [Pseudomonadota bacterium]